MMKKHRKRDKSNECGKSENENHKIEGGREVEEQEQFNLKSCPISYPKTYQAPALEEGPRTCKLVGLWTREEPFVGPQDWRRDLYSDARCAESQLKIFFGDGHCVASAFCVVVPL